jgi:quinol-cytochrome oxidoreductase complex cytochrome b subunit
MKHNMGRTDRIIRSTIAACLVYAIITKSVGGPLVWIFGVLAVALGATAVFGYCPPYSWLGIKTCSCEEHDEKRSKST